MKSDVADIVDTLVGLAKEKYPDLPKKLIDKLVRIQADHFEDPGKAARLMRDGIEDFLSSAGKRNA